MQGPKQADGRVPAGAMRQSILDDLPEIADIRSEDLREKVIAGWAFSLSGSSFPRISALPGEGNPNILVLRRGKKASIEHSSKSPPLNAAGFDKLKGSIPNWSQPRR